MDERQTIAPPKGRERLHEAGVGTGLGPLPRIVPCLCLPSCVFFAFFGTAETKLGHHSIPGAGLAGRARVSGGECTVSGLPRRCETVECAGINRRGAVNGRVATHRPLFAGNY